MQRSSKRAWSRPTGVALIVLALLVAGGAPATEPGDEAQPDAVPLDRLLRLPSGSGQDSELERRGGHTKAEWETRFRDARAAEVEAREAIARTRAAIERKASEDGGGQWRMGAPGLGNVDTGREPGDTPLDYKLTQTLRRNREDLARAERELQDLEVEANLAAVPNDWRALPDTLEASEL